MKIVKLPRPKKVEPEKPKWYRGEPKPTKMTVARKFSGIDKEKRAQEMRDNPTPTEKIMLDLLTEHEIKFKSQVVILGYIADFYFKQAKAILEVDGLIHRSRKKYDNRRDHHFREAGFRVLRINAARLFKEPQAVIEEVKAYLKKGRAKKRVVKNVKVKKTKGKITRWQDVPRLSVNHLPTK